MPSLTLKDIPKNLLERLRERARGERRSLTQQVFVLLERGLEARPAAHRDRVSEQIEAWRRLAGSWVSDESSEDEIRHIYDARSRGRDV